MPIYSRNDEVALNLIDQALASCPDGTEAAATACVKDALSTSTMGLRALASSIPGCAVGSVCTYEHTTQRRLGLIPSYATMVKREWVLTLDLRQAREVARVLVTVRDRNLFVATPAKSTTVAPATAPSR